MTACPEAKILRYDRDSASHKTSHEAFFAAFSKGAADVLIGTQMVAKGLDIAKVTLVGVISADTGLQFPDFRAAEHTFQVLTQVAGRAGRHNLQGKVIIQTYVPEHYAIQAAKEHDYDRFYRQEIQYRQELGYPPFSKLINISIAGTEENKALGVSNELAEQLRQRLGAAVLGPAPAVIAKIRGDWRYQIQLKGEDLTPMRKAVLETLGAVSIPSKVKVAVDVEPMF
jgi:primosomal protein N' (replication factor Y)